MVDRLPPGSEGGAAQTTAAAAGPAAAPPAAAAATSAIAAMQGQLKRSIAEVRSRRPAAPLAAPGPSSASEPASDEEDPHEAMVRAAAAADAPPLGSLKSGGLGAWIPTVEAETQALVVEAVGWWLDQGGTTGESRAKRPRRDGDMGMSHDRTAP